MISAIVLTKNEGKNIEDCLKTLTWCGEIIVVDDYSADNTVALAVAAGAKVFRHRLGNDFAGQRNFGLQKVYTEQSRSARADWILFVDADERVTPELHQEILKAITKNEFRGFNLRRTDFWGGRWLKHGETADVRLLRLGQKKSGKWQRKVHEFWDIKGNIGKLKNPILHYPHPNLDDFLGDINFYSTLHAEAFYEQPIKPRSFRIVANPLGKFIVSWIFKLGFLDGTPGFILALMMSFHSFLAQSKLYLKWRK